MQTSLNAVEDGIKKNIKSIIEKEEKIYNESQKQLSTIGDTKISNKPTRPPYCNYDNFDGYGKCDSYQPGKHNSGFCDDNHGWNTEDADPNCKSFYACNMDESKCGVNYGNDYNEKNKKSPPAPPDWYCDYNTFRGHSGAGCDTYTNPNHGNSTYCDDYMNMSSDNPNMNCRALDACNMDESKCQN